MTRLVRQFYSLICLDGGWGYHFLNSNNDITVSSFSWARRHKRKFSAVITIEDPDKHYGIRFHSAPHPEHLILRFVDLDAPLPAPYCHLGRNRLASVDDISSALDFARDKEKLLIHCEAGIGRSPALCYVILCDRYGPGGEEQALYDLLAMQRNASPNLHVIALGDKILARHGKMVEVVEEWYKSTPANRRRRELNRKAYLYV
jgi:predicted protein tyrosine phosphatase